MDENNVVGRITFWVIHNSPKKNSYIDNIKVMLSNVKMVLIQFTQLFFFKGIYTTLSIITLHFFFSFIFVSMVHDLLYRYASHVIFFKG